MTYYRVTNGSGHPARIIKADNKAQVRAHLLIPIKIEPAKTDEVIAFIEEKGVIETAEKEAPELEHVV